MVATLDDAPEVYEMPAAAFAAKFPPSLYSDSWDTIDDSDEVYDNPDDPDGEYDTRFASGGDHGWDMGDLIDSIAAEGLHTPLPSKRRPSCGTS